MLDTSYGPAIVLAGLHHVLHALVTGVLLDDPPVALEPPVELDAPPADESPPVLPALPPVAFAPPVELDAPPVDESPPVLASTSPVLPAVDVGVPMTTVLMLDGSPPVPANW
jgi:hypothetical protein